MKTKDDFLKEILLSRKDAIPGLYGSNVLPAIQIFRDIKNREEYKAYHDAIKELLEGNDKKNRDFAISLCLGFIIFKDVET